jgi:uncharacterized protein YndB with AHSA1/START domain
MARNVVYVDVPPERVFEVLADPRLYPRWVVGAKSLRSADADFPARGTRFHHRVGVGPLALADHTEVLEVVPPRRIVLRAKARPLGTATVVVEVDPDGRGSRVTLVEDPGDPLTALLFTPLTHLLVRVRNAESLRRLRAIAEWRARGVPREHRRAA